MDSIYEDLIKNIEQTSEALKTAEGEEHTRLAKVYEMQLKALVAYQEQQDRVDADNARLKIEEKKLEIERKRQKHETAGLWARVGIAAAEFGSGIGLGLLYLKANMKYGGMVGKDAKAIFNEIKRIKL